MVNGDLFNKKCGTIYLIPHPEGGYIFSQVGFGGDLGIFFEKVQNDNEFIEYSSNIMFRVNYGHLSPKQHNWINKGLYPFKYGLSEIFPYFYRPIGSNECKIVYLNGKECSVECSREHEFEQLATWSHEHIIKRFMQGL